MAPLKLPLWMVRVLVPLLMFRIPDPESAPMVESAAKLTVAEEPFSSEPMELRPPVLVKSRIPELMAVTMVLPAPPTLIRPSLRRMVPEPTPPSVSVIRSRFRIPAVSLVSEPVPVTVAPAPMAGELPALTVTRTSEPSMLSVPPFRRVMKDEGPEPCRVREPPFMAPTEMLLVAVAVALPPKLVTRAWTPFNVATPPVKFVIVVDWPLKECVPPVRWVIFTSAEVEVMTPPRTLVNSPRVPVRLTVPFSRVTTSAVPAKFTVPEPSTTIRPTVAAPETLTLR